MTTERREWNHQPDLPIRTSPLWEWPPRPLAALKWYRDAWLPVTVNLMILGLAWASWLALTPAMATMAEPGLWVLAIYLRNLALMVAVAGGLHLWFYTFRGQGDRLRYDTRDLPAGRRFTFGTQLADNVFWTCTSGVGIWSAYEALLLWSFASGRLEVMPFAAHPVWFVAIFFLIPVWESFYFYWIHRALHWPPLYRLAHALHHRNTNVGPWSGLSMHPIEHVIFLGSVLVHFVIPSHPVHVVFHLQFYALLAVTTHTGFEHLFARNRERLRLGTFHHQMHHRYFECNYGNLDVPWDKLFGSFHDGTPEARARMRERLRTRNAAR